MLGGEGLNVTCINMEVAQHMAEFLCVGNGVKLGRVAKLR